LVVVVVVETFVDVPVVDVAVDVVVVVLDGFPLEVDPVAEPEVGDVVVVD
jgi:hypothetical protein